MIGIEEKFLAVCAKNRQEADKIGVRIRPIESLQQVHRILSGHRQSDGFGLLEQKGRLDLSVEALAVKKPFTELFSDEEANTALDRLLDAGYSFNK